VKKFLRLFALSSALVIIFFTGCNKDNKENKENVTNKNKTGFGWKDGVSAADIPDFPISGLLSGKEIMPVYVCFEKWRGSNDNVFVFSLSKPAQQCGFIENFQGFKLSNKGNAFNTGEWVKSKFDDDPKTYESYFVVSGSDKSSVNWNCALVIESMDNKTVKGKISLFFNDTAKSWIAGKFEASVCNN